MSHVWRLSLILTVISQISLSSLSASTLLLKKKVISNSAQGFTMDGDAESSARVEEKKFQSPEDLENFLKNLDPNEYEWEKPVKISLDDLSLQERAAKELEVDPLLSDQWSIFPNFQDKETFPGVDIDAIRAWDITTGSSHVYVYILDSGVDDRDPDLQGRVIAQFNALSPGDAANDENDHGTHVTSIIAASGNNNYGIKGVVPGDIRVIAVKFIGASNGSDSTAALRALDWIIDDIKNRQKEDPDGRFIVSNSWGGDYSKFIEEKMQELGRMGVLLITSAGNHSRDNDKVGYFPCNLKVNGNTCVAASDYYDNVANFSGYGAQNVHLLAPGVQIFGIVRGEVNGNSFKSIYRRKNGTSQAVPHVTGVAALVWAANPKLSHLDVHEILINSVDRIPNADGKVLSSGRLNAYRAVLIASGRDPSEANSKALAATATEGSEGDGGGCSLNPVAKQSPLALSFFLGIFSLALIQIGQSRRLARGLNKK